MLRLFSKVRKTLLSENKFNKYVLYAVGEIVLVVIGILIALEINTQNDIRKERAKEVHYLSNIKKDLNLNIQELDRYISVRTDNIDAASAIIEHFEGKPIEDFDAFNALGVPIYSWQKFYQQNNTFQELVNSGNLSLIKNDQIKNMLMDIESLYKKTKGEEDHYRFDTEELLYKPLYSLMDLNPMINSYKYKMSNGTLGKNHPVSHQYYEDFLKSTEIKNGFILTIFQFSVMNEMMQEMKTMSLKLIELIDEEIKS